MKQVPRNHQKKTLKQKSYWRSKRAQFFILFVAVVGLLAVGNTYYNFNFFIPILFVLLCPIFMYFMMGGHHHDKDDSK